MSLDTAGMGCPPRAVWPGRRDDGGRHRTSLILLRIRRLGFESLRARHCLRRSSHWFLSGRIVVFVIWPYFGLTRIVGRAASAASAALSQDLSDLVNPGECLTALGQVVVARVEVGLHRERGVVVLCPPADDGDGRCPGRVRGWNPLLRAPGGRAGARPGPAAIPRPTAGAAARVGWPSRPRPCR